MAGRAVLLAGPPGTGKVLFSLFIQNNVFQELFSFYFLPKPFWGSGYVLFSSTGFSFSLRY